MKFRVGDVILMEATVSEVKDKLLRVIPSNYQQIYDGYTRQGYYAVDPDKTQLISRKINVGDKFQRLRDGEIAVVFGFDSCVRQEDNVVFYTGSSDHKVYHTMNRLLFLNAFTLVYY